MGEVMRIDKKRFTPAGLPIINFLIEHRSIQSEAGLDKEVNLVIDSVIIGRLTNREIKIGEKLFFEGFLEKRSKNSKQIIFHISKIQDIVK